MARKNFHLDLYKSLEGAQNVTTTVRNLPNYSKDIVKVISDFSSAAYFHRHFPGVLESMKIAQEIDAEKGKLIANMGFEEANKYYEKIVLESYQQRETNSYYIFQNLFLKNEEFK